MGVLSNQLGLFPRGRTFLQNTGTIDTSNYSGVHLEGYAQAFRVPALSSGAAAGSAMVTSEADISRQDAGAQVGIIVRNVAPATGGHDAAGNLLPGRLVVWKAGFRRRRVDGAPTATGQEIAGVVDPLLPSAGVATGDLFWLIVQGPTLCLSDLAGDTGTDFLEGIALVNATGATSGATTAGRIREIDTTGSTTTLANQILNRIGRAMSANTTSQTNRFVLVDLNLPL